MKFLESIPDTYDDFGNLCLEDDSAKSAQKIVPLTLVAKKIPMKFAEFKISNVANKMLSAETIAISAEGLSFYSPVSIPLGTLTRVWLEIPDYWAKKSKHVSYRHTDAPSYFQVLCRVQAAEETGKRNQKFQLTAVIVNLDPVDEKVLRDYLGIAEDSR